MTAVPVPPLTDEQIRAHVADIITDCMDKARYDKGEYYNPQLMSDRVAGDIHALYEASLRAARAELDQARDSIAFGDAEYARLTRERDRAERDRDQAQAEVAEYTQHLANGPVPDDVDTLRRYVQYARSAARYEKAGNEKLRARAVEVLRERDAARAENEQLRGELHQMRDLSSVDLATIDELRGEITALAATLASLRAALVRAEETAARVRSRLTSHYLAQIVCDHDRGLDNPICACSLVHLGWHPSVGAAVAAWVDHVMDDVHGGEALAADAPADARAEADRRVATFNALAAERTYPDDALVDAYKAARAALVAADAPAASEPEVKP